MALSSTTSRIQYSGNGSTTVFSFPYYFLAQGDLVVIVTSALGVETTKTITTHYTVSGAGVAAGGSVTMLTAPASGETLTIYRDPDLTQGLDLRENDSLPAESVEESLDRLTMIAQRLDSQVQNVVKLSNGFVGTFDTTLPGDLAGVADSIPVTNADGDGWADAADWILATDLTNASANAAAAAASAVAAAASESAAAASAVAADASADAALVSENAAAATLANSVLKSIIDADGDLIVGTGDNTYTRLAIGTDNQVLTVDTTVTPKKMKWSATSVGQGSQGFGTTITSSGKTLSASDDGKIFKLDSSGGAITINAHAADSGFKVTFVDAGGVLSTSAATFVRNGSQKIQNISGNYVMESDYGVWTWYFDGTDWWMGE